MKKYAIIGTGAVGGYFSVKLSQAHLDVHCLLKSDYEFVKENGLTLFTENKRYTANVHCYNSSNDMPQCDIILVTLKTFDNFLLKSILPKITHKNSLVILIQNGIGMEQELTDFINPSNLIGACTSLKVSKESPGTIRHFGFNSIDIANFYNEKASSVIDDIIFTFEKSGFTCVKYDNLQTMRWKKLAVNIPTSGLQVVLNASMQELIQEPSSYKLLCDITQEVIKTAKKCGSKLPDDYYEYRLKVFDNVLKLPTYYNSMKEDFDADRKLELHSIYENVIKIATQHECEMPLTDMLYHQLLYLVEKNFQKAKIQP